jgi:hypothetical protein
VHGRHFFEALIRENLDLDRPDACACSTRSGSPARRQGPPLGIGTAHHGRRGAERARLCFLTATARQLERLRVEYKSSHVKQYFKEQHAPRSETTINNPIDLEPAG